MNLKSISWKPRAKQSYVSLGCYSISKLLVLTYFKHCLLIYIIFLPFKLRLGVYEYKFKIMRCIEYFHELIVPCLLKPFFIFCNIWTRPRNRNYASGNTLRLNIYEINDIIMWGWQDTLIFLALFSITNDDWLNNVNN